MKGLMLILLLISGAAFGQDIKVEYNKDHDFTQYKTFRFGEAEVITPKDQRQFTDAQLHEWIKNAIKKELEFKGLSQKDSTADLTISYAVGAVTRTNAGDLGPMGLTPGSTERTYMQDVRQYSLIIDLNERNNSLVWRINSNTSISPADAEKLIQGIVQKGFHKFAKPEKKKKKR